MKLSPPDGTRYTFSQDAVRRLEIVGTLRRLYESWGYAPVEVPALEHYDPAHPAAAKSFKLSDRDSGVLALRADFTPALARLRAPLLPRSGGYKRGYEHRYKHRYKHYAPPLSLLRHPLAGHRPGFGAHPRVYASRARARRHIPTQKPTPNSFT